MKNVTPTLLSAQELKFCDAQLSGLGKAKSAIAAGYSEVSAHAQASRMLKRPRVAEYLARAQVKVQEKTLSRRERILQELELLAFARVERLVRIDENGLPQVDWSQATPEDLAAVQSVQSKRRTSYGPKGDVLGVEDQSKFTIGDKYRGLELLGKHEGLFSTDKVEVTIDVADRLLNARQRLEALAAPSDED